MLRAVLRKKLPSPVEGPPSDGPRPWVHPALPDAALLVSKALLSLQPPLSVELSLYPATLSWDKSRGGDGKQS